ncbi:MAG TPA: hypothetical protein GXX30_03835 [Firmicutes bacterium]|nr:hypothetical protein [Candidatus Fermentithermobacillaceae bacterium]
MNLVDLVEKSGARSVAVVGTAKNVGKTVTMSYLAQELASRGLVLGLVSSGRDGESIDSLTGEPKPSVVPPEGSWVATAEGVLGEAAAFIEIVDVLERIGLFGRLVVGRVVEQAPIELVGPQSARELSALVKKLLAFGADIVLVDGALDRRAAASPKVTEASILATGASSSANLKTIAEEIAFLTWLWSRVPPESRLLETLSRKAMAMNVVTFIDQEFLLRPTEYPTCLGFEEDILEESGDSIAVVVPGAVSEKFLSEARAWTERKDFAVIARDATCIFAAKDPGVKLHVIEPIHLLAITVNPVSYRGMSYEPKEMVRAVSAAVRAAVGRTVPVFDVVSGEKSIRGVAGVAMG